MLHRAFVKSRLKIHHIYFVLALFDVMMILSSLYIGHRIARVHESSAEDTRSWAQSLGQFAELSELGAAVDGPSNDVLENHDQKGESIKAEASYQAFVQSAAGFRHHMMALPQTSEVEGVLKGFDKVEAEMSDMMSETRKALDEFGRGDVTAASNHMVLVDRSYGQFNAASNDVSAELRHIQLAHVDRQLLVAAKIRKFEYLIACAVLLMVGAVTFYGHYLSRAFAHAADQREAQNLQLLEKSEALEKAKAAADEANIAKSRFLASMSHEIRTPMNGVLGMTDLLIRSGLTDKQLRFAQTIYKSGTSLLTIINDILDFSRIEAGKLELDAHEFDLRACVENSIELLAESARSKEIDLSLYLANDVPRVLIGDQVRVRQILMNLIGNAIKFTSKGGVAVRVVSDNSQTGHAAIRFEIHDTGIGIEEGVLAKLFRPFAQADTSISRQFGGTGLGLSIAQQLVSMMGGQLTIESDVGFGTKATVSVNLEVAADSGYAPQLGTDIDLKGQRILIVDDREANREIVKAYLEDTGAIVTSAVSAEQALVTLRAAHKAGQGFQLAVIDMVLPGMNGMELGRTIRVDPRFDGVEFLMLSSSAFAGDTQLARALGFREFLMKPVLRPDLLTAIGRSLRREVQPQAGAIKPMPEAIQPATAAATPLRFNARILIAEDNPINVEVAMQFVREYGCEFQVVGNGLKAVEAAALAHFDLILMDCQMPAMDGLTATAEIRRAAHAAGKARIPIIAVTANAFEKDRQDCMSAGMDDYLSKPFSPEELGDIFTKWLPVSSRAKDGDTAFANGEVTLNIPYLKRMFAGRPELAAKLFKAYNEHAPMTMRRLHEACETSDAAAVRIASHSLKSSSASVGAERLSTLMARLETLARSGFDQRTAVALATVGRDEMKMVLAAITEMRAPAAKADVA